MNSKNNRANKFKKYIVLVGNSSVERDYTSFIDNASHVVRFNECKNYNQKTGSKITSLALTNIGSPARDFSIDNKLSLLPFWPNVEEIWFPRNKSVHMKYNKLYKSNTLNPISLEPIENFSKDIISGNNITSKIIIFSREINECAFLSLFCCDSRPFPMPSTGFLALIYVITSSRFKDYDISLVGFNFEGWTGHPWPAERGVIAKLETLGRVVLHKI